MTGRYYGDGSTYPWYAPAGYIRQHQAHLKALKMSETDSIIRASKNFTMIKSVHRHQSGKGARFQNHKVTSYKIAANYFIMGEGKRQSRDAEVSALINADFDRSRSNGRTTWKFYNQRDADKAWVLLGLKYS